jgi:hypothetical protein
MRSPFWFNGFRYFMRNPTVILIPSFNENRKRSPAQTGRPDHQAKGALGCGGEIEIHLYRRDAVVQYSQEMSVLQDGSSRVFQSECVFSRFHSNWKKKGDAEQFRWEMYLIRRFLGLIATRRGEGSQVYSHRKRRDNGWSLLRRGTRLLFGSVLLRDARLAAPASVIPNKPHDCEQDSENG